MVINGYRFTWRRFAWGDAVVVIYARRRFLGFLWRRWKRVAVMDNCCKSYLWAKYATPEQLESWFTTALGAFHAYNNAWGVIA